MAIIVTREMAGEIPRLEAELLPENAAVIAENCDLSSHGLRSWREPLLVFSPSVAGTLQSLYRMYSGATDYWLTWAAIVHAVRGPIAGDTEFRLYYTGDPAGNGWPKKTNLALATGAGNYPADYLEMGVPAPDAAPAISSTGGSGADLTRHYVSTFVTSWGEESAPSPVAEDVGKVDDTVTVNPDDTAPAGWSKTDITKQRIYRRFTNAAGVTEFYFAVERLLADGAWTDTVTDAVLVTQGLLPTSRFAVAGSAWVPPPSNMKNLCMGNNGIAAGSSGNILCFSEPFHPHAWPERYRKALPWEIVCIIPVGNSFVVGTKGRPYVITGTHPDRMDQRQIQRDDMACVSQRSAALSGVGPLFATANGLALVIGQPDHVTDAFLGRKRWQERYYPDTLLGVSWNDKYVGFFDTGVGRRGFIFDRGNTNGPLTSISKEVTGAYTDPETNELYLIIGNSIYKWDADPHNFMNYYWRGKVHVLPKPKNMGAFKVDGDYSFLKGAIEAEQAQETADVATNTATIAALPVDDWPDTPHPLRGATGTWITGGYMRRGSEPQSLAPGPNGNVIYTGGTLLVGGAFSTFNTRGLTFELWAYNEDEAVQAMELKHAEMVDSARTHTLPDGYLSRKYQIGLSGNLPVQPPLPVASTAKELERA